MVEPIKPSYWSVYQTDPLCKDIQVTTKDVRTMTFTFVSDDERLEVQNLISSMAFWSEEKMAEKLFAFSYKKNSLPKPQDLYTRNSCWYNPEEEFERQGLNKCDFRGAILTY